MGPDVPFSRAHRITLIGDSLLQFVSLAVNREALAAVRRNFAEEGKGRDAVLVSYGADNMTNDGATTYALTGAEAADTFADSWVPMPCFRAGPHDDVGQQAGPSNWVRLRLIRDGGDFRLVLAFDTALADPTAGRADVSPTLDDARTGTPFALAGNTGAIADFAGEPWVDDWITADPSGGGTPQKLERLARYMTLLEALMESGVLPAVTVEGSVPGRLGDRAPSRAVDLVIGVADRTFEVSLIDVARFEMGASHAVGPLVMRDLERPWLVHGSGAMSADVAFSKPEFGNDAASRLSGRADAFTWPSLIRCGGEARALARRLAPDAPPAVETDLLAAVLDDTPHDHVWRLAVPERDRNFRLPFVSGATLGLMTETGERVASGTGRTGATRARFSRSSLLSLAVHEIVLQAIAAANAADVQFDRTARTPSCLRRVLVSLPDGLHDLERAAARRRIDDGVALAFDALRWPGATRPQVVYAPSRAQALLHAHLHNEIAHRFVGRAPAYLHLLAGPVRPAGTSINLAVIDVGQSRTTLDISGLLISDTTRLALTHVAGDTAGVGLDDVVAALGRDLVLPALGNQLAKARLADARGFLRRICDLAGPPDERRITERIVERTVMQAARGLLALHLKSTPGATGLPVETTLRALLGPGADDMVLQRIEALALAEGSNAVTLLDMPVIASASDVGRITSGTLMPALRAACRAIRRAHCSLLVIAGDPAVTTLVRDAASAEACVSADRVIDLAHHRFGAWIGERDVDSARAAGAMLAAADQDAEPQRHAYHLAFDDASLRKPLFKCEPVRVPAASEQEHTFVFDGAPRTIGATRLDSQTWPLRPLLRLEPASRESLQQLAMPLTVTLALGPGAAWAPDGLQIRSVRDARGRNLPPTLLALTRALQRRHDLVGAAHPTARMANGGQA